MTQSALEETGSASHLGERTELIRFAPAGWEVLISAAWDGERWRMVALRVHHPERTETEPGAWAERYRALWTELDPDRIAEINPPELFEVPPPRFLPALPEELRSRQFDIDQFWYQAHWINVGGFDEDAQWALRSFELVAKPPTDQ
ncbi:MAG: hypothetical protein V2J20_05720 [Wenzhouxiangella sp.]|nr:hypothetical protein [Wenzhouxiangella sp.]